MRYWLLAILLIPSTVFGGQQFKGVHAAIFASTGAVAVASGEGGGGGSVFISTAWVSGKLSASAETLVITPSMKPSTGSLITVGIIFGQNVMTSAVDNRGNNYILAATENRQSGAQASVYHFIATATYNGAYTVTFTAENPTSYTAGMVISSITAGKTPSVDVTTNSWSGTTGNAIVKMGTTSVTNAATGLCMAAFYDDSGINDAITEQTPWNLIGEEQDGSSYVAGSIVYRTSNVSTVQVMGNWTLAAAKQWNSVTTCYKAE